MKQNYLKENKYYLQQNQLYISNNSDSQSSSESAMDHIFNKDYDLQITPFNNNYDHKLDSTINNCIANNQNYDSSNHLSSYNLNTMQDDRMNSTNTFHYLSITSQLKEQTAFLSQQKLNISQDNNYVIRTNVDKNIVAIKHEKSNHQCCIISKAISKPTNISKRNNSKDSSDNENYGKGSSAKVSTQNGLCFSPGSIMINCKKKKKFQIVNLVKDVVLDKSFLIPGQIIINTQFDQGYRNIYMNSDLYQRAKKVEQVIYNKERETFESHFSTNYFGLTDFDFVIRLLESKQNQQIYEQAQVLKTYQQFIQMHQQVIKGIQDSGLIDQQLFIQNTDKFLKEGDEIIGKMSKDSVYIYFFNRINYNKNNYEELRFGFNKGMCAIVGLEQEEAVQFSNQMLILCMMTPESQLKYYMNVLQSEMSGQTSINIDYQQYTYEGIKIRLTTKQQIIHFPGQFSPKDFSLRILEIEPDALTLQQLIEERNKNGVDNKFNDQQNSFKKDQFFRYKAGLQFLEEFYEKKKPKILPKPLRCDFVIKDAAQSEKNKKSLL